MQSVGGGEEEELAVRWPPWEDHVSLPTVVLPAEDDLVGLDRLRYERTLGRVDALVERGVEVTGREEFWDVTFDDILEATRRGHRGLASLDEAVRVMRAREASR